MSYAREKNNITDEVTVTELQAGAARLQITPPVGIELAGYTPRVRNSNRSTAVHDPLWARALALSGPEKTVLIIVLDLLGIELPTTRHVRSRICAGLPLRPENVLVCCTHNHSAPSILVKHEAHVRVDPAWQSSALEATVNVALEAYARRRPASLSFGRSEVHDVGANRKTILDDGAIFHFSGLYGRQPPAGRTVVETGPIDPELAVLCARDTSGQIIALLVNFACHPWLYNGDRISSELSGACVAWLEQQLSPANPGMVALFTPGTGSNITTVQHQTPIPADAAEQERWYTAERRRLGAILGRAALQASRGIDAFAQGGAVSAQLCPVAAPAYRQKLAQVLAEHSRLPPADEVMETEVQVMRLGEIALAGLPSEVYVEYGLEIKARSCYRDTMVLSYCNDYFADIITHQAVQENCCPELQWTGVHPDVRGLIMGCLEQSGILC